MIGPNCLLMSDNKTQIFIFVKSNKIHKIQQTTIKCLLLLIFFLQKKNHFLWAPLCKNLKVVNSICNGKASIYSYNVFWE